MTIVAFLFRTPYCKDQTHWYIYVINNETKIIKVWDSIRKEDSSKFSEVRKGITNILRHYKAKITEHEFQISDNGGGYKQRGSY